MTKYYVVWKVEEWKTERRKQEKLKDGMRGKTNRDKIEIEEKKKRGKNCTEEKGDSCIGKVTPREGERERENSMEEEGRVFRNVMAGVVVERKSRKMREERRKDEG